MKRIEDIEKMSISELMDAASGSDVSAPEGLQETLRRTVDALEFIQSEDTAAVTTLRRRKWSYVGIAACLTLLLGSGLTVWSLLEPRDTFKDPAEAYAQVERTLATVSSKVNRGVDLAIEADQQIRQSTTAIFDKIK